MSQSTQFESNIALINYPKQAVSGRTLPKNKIYEHNDVNTRLKDLFTEQMELIVWRYKLASETINLPARPGVLELQTFSIQLKTSELNLDVLHRIDGAVQSPIIFELNFDGRTKAIAAYKRLNESDASRWVLSSHFVTAWLPSDNERAAALLALDLGDLYEQVFHRLTPMPARPQESLVDLVVRVEMVAVKQREAEKAASRLVKKKQFNRRVEISAQLRQLKNELEELTGRENARRRA